MYLNQYWKDERLSFSPEEDKALTLSGDFAEKIWVPDTFFANDKNRYELDQHAVINLIQSDTMAFPTNYPLSSIKSSQMR